MITRISKIAQLPKSIRDDLNHRLENGKQGPDLLPWLNALSETKELLAEKFEGRPITHQNLSEWRRGGYRDWLQQQHRKEWFDRFTENETELAQHDKCGDTYEAMSRIFIVETGQAADALQYIKNPQERALCLQNLMREFTRLQNAYNYSRRVQLDFDKWNTHPDAEPLPQIEEQDDAEPEGLGAPCRPPGPSRRLPAPSPGAPISNRLNASTSPALEEAPSNAPTEDPILNTADSQLSEPNSPEIPAAPQAISNPTCVQHLAGLPEIPLPCQAIPTPAPTPTPAQKYKIHSIPIRGRRFVCIEG